ncbi:hypothetical protein [Mycoplasma sp. P36-A1]|uniref:hypothetical protein n=1 Tax=Mycoplasma sp. P36-A1 TaxID=3252900 RepID=UPI003C2ACF88
MKNYIWFNPVVKKLTNQSELETFMKTFNYEEVNTNANYLEVVRDKYNKHVKECCNLTVDMRCPLAAEYVKDNYDCNYNYPDIHPILVHYAIELANLYIKSKTDYLIITTPCLSLAEYGNKLGITNVRFVP